MIYAAESYRRRAVYASADTRRYVRDERAHIPLWTTRERGVATRLRLLNRRDRNDYAR